MQITIGDRTRQNMKLFGLIKYPFDETQLKKAYRQAVKEAHPDTGGSEDKFKRVNKAYVELLPLCIMATPETAIKINKQYTSEKDDLFASILWLKCKKCNGTGNIIHERRENIFTVTKCLKCFGAGRFKIELFNPVIPIGAVLDHKEPKEEDKCLLNNKP